MPVRVLFYTMLFLLACAAHADFAAGFGASNAACGTGVPTAWVEFDNGDARRPARFYARTGPDGGCAGQATAVDASAAWRMPLRGSWSLAVAGAYDQRAQPFEYGCAETDPACRPLPGKLFRGAAVVTVSALLGARYDGGDWSAELRYDAVEQDYETGGGIPPFSLAWSRRVGPVQLHGTLMPRWIGDVSATVDLGERMRLALRANANAALLAHPAPAWIEAADGARWARLGGPRTVYGIDFGVRF